MEEVSRKTLVDEKMGARESIAAFNQKASLAGGGQREQPRSI